MEQANEELAEIFSAMNANRLEERNTIMPQVGAYAYAMAEAEQAKKEMERLSEPFREKHKRLYHRQTVLDQRISIFRRVRLYRDKVEALVKEDMFDQSEIGNYSKAANVFFEDHMHNYYWNENSAGRFWVTVAEDLDASKASNYVNGENEHVLDMYKAFGIAGDKTRTVESRHAELTSMFNNFFGFWM